MNNGEAPTDGYRGASPVPPPGVPVNPVDVERAIMAVSNDIAKGVRLVSDALETFKTAGREYDLAYARAFMAYQGPAHSKRYAADLATSKERQAMDVAEVAYKYAASRAKALEAELSANQSVMRSVTGMYGAAHG